MSRPVLRFGTDGWRGLIARDCTFDTIERLSLAFARRYREGALGPGDRARVVVGHDTRFLSPELARCAAETLARCGLEVLLADRPIPTQAVSFHVKRLGLSGGIAITASHNPAEYNGFKVKAHYGGSAVPQIYAGIQREIDAPEPPASAPGTVQLEDLRTPYRRGLEILVDTPAIQNAGLSLIHDGMYGAGALLIGEAVSGGATRIETLRGSRDALFGGVHPEPIAANLAETAERVREGGFALALANDGDADRLGVLDSAGRFVSAHRILALLLLHVYRRRGLSGGIARTFSTSLLIDRIARRFDVPLFETAIGFKYVADLMISGRVAAGGEESGGYGFAFHLPERDGILSGLLLLESLAMTGHTLEEELDSLAREFGSLEYARKDIYLPVPVIEAFLAEARSHPPASIAGAGVTGVQDLDGVKYLFGDAGWVLHRLSGTEPMIRLYCEHEDGDTVAHILAATEERLRAFAGQMPPSAA
jgi:phosphomannomutase